MLHQEIFELLPLGDLEVDWLVELLGAEVDRADEIVALVAMLRLSSPRFIGSM